MGGGIICPPPPPDGVILRPPSSARVKQSTKWRTMSVSGTPFHLRALYLCFEIFTCFRHQIPWNIEARQKFELVKSTANHGTSPTVLSRSMHTTAPTNVPTPTHGQTVRQRTVTYTAKCLCANPAEDASSGATGTRCTIATRDATKRSPCQYCCCWKLWSLHSAHQFGLIYAIS